MDNAAGKGVVVHGAADDADIDVCDDDGDDADADGDTGGDENI